jgi:hypothetical protein
VPGMVSLGAGFPSVVLPSPSPAVCGDGASQTTLGLGVDDEPIEVDQSQTVSRVVMDETTHNCADCDATYLSYQYHWGNRELDAK